MKNQLDFCGLNCPEPVIRTRNFLDEKKPQALCVLVDNVAASENVSRFLQRRGYECLVKKKNEKLWSIEATNCGCTITEPEVSSKPAQESCKTAVLLTTEFLGQGDDSLGEKLMANFLATLQEFGNDLWRIILLNGAVKLASKAGKACESLKALEAAGVTIMVCGTCLEFYGLTEQKQVGETTNMLDVVTGLALADKVVRP